MEKIKLGTPAQTADYLTPLLAEKYQEEFWVLALNSKNELIASECVFKGNLVNVLVHPREVFYFAITSHAATIIVAHNHPSGHCEPSGDDDNVTSHLFESGKILGIPVLDHIIVGGWNDCYSYAENGALDI